MVSPCESRSFMNNPLEGEFLSYSRVADHLTNWFIFESFKAFLTFSLNLYAKYYQIIINQMTLMLNLFVLTFILSGALWIDIDSIPMVRVWRIYFYYSYSCSYSSSSSFTWWDNEEQHWRWSGLSFIFFSFFFFSSLSLRFFLFLFGQLEVATYMKWIIPPFLSYCSFFLLLCDLFSLILSSSSPHSWLDEGRAIKHLSLLLFFIRSEIYPYYSPPLLTLFFTFFRQIVVWFSIVIVIFFYEEYHAFSLSNLSWTPKIFIFKI